MLRELKLTGLAAIITATSTLHSNAKSLIEEKSQLGYDDVEHIVDNKEHYLALKNGAILTVDKSTDEEISSIYIDEKAIAVLSSKNNISYAVLPDGYLLKIDLKSKEITEDNSKRLSPYSVGSEKLVDASLNQDDINEFLVVYDNDRFAQLDKKGNLEFYFWDNEKEISKKRTQEISKVEGSVSNTGIFIGTIVYSDGQSREITQENQNTLDMNSIYDFK